MSDVALGPGWWIASDGKWYAPELHPSVRKDEAGNAAPANGSVAARLSKDNPANHVGPTFPDLYQKAVAGSSLADAVTVKYDNADGTPAQPGSAQAAANAAAAATTTAAAPAKKKWRKGS